MVWFSIFDNHEICLVFDAFIKLGLMERWLGQRKNLFITDVEGLQWKLKRQCTFYAQSVCIDLERLNLHHFYLGYLRLNYKPLGQ